MSERLEFLGGEYLRLAHTQESLGDEAGARQTAFGVAPHLITLGKAIPKETDERRDIDQIACETIGLIGSLDTPDARQLLASIQSEFFKTLALSHPIGKLAVELLVARQPYVAVEIAGTLDKVGLLTLWQKSITLLTEDPSQENRALVRDMIAAVEEDFPGYYTKLNELDVFAPGVFNVLYLANQSDYLALALASIEERGVADRALEDVAYWCGVDNDQGRLEQLLSSIQEYNVPVSTARVTKIHKHFEKGQNDSQSASPTQD